VRDDPLSSTPETFLRPSSAPALPIDANNPSRRCGNLTNMMLELEDLCQYAQDTRAMQAASATLVSPR
jgi:hypothetical protein